ncbi:MAG: glutamate formimidoyltransferase [Gemmatimonadaceae bacterium]|nr:glutamate formimidoyltransferase [Gemmatimonadaceae bacterium]
MTTPLVECVPNFSEGRDPAVIAALREAIASTPGAHVLDVSSDVSHHRTVITFVARLDAAVPAALAAMRVARDRIDLNAHAGVHPRIGATDVVPFIPLDGTTMQQCAALAAELGARAASELGIPVYLYEHAAQKPERRNLAHVRGSGFETLRDIIATDPDRAPDFGATAVHPTAGATAVGARDFLLAYNVYLGGEENLPVAQAVARAIRERDGGLPGLKALGLAVDGQAQVSMNLVDMDRTGLHAAYDAVAGQAARHGVDVTWSEIIGLVPERALLDAGAHHLQLRERAEDKVLEARLRSLAPSTPVPLLDRIAAATPTPGGGSAVAHAASLAAAVTQMVAGVTLGRQRYAHVASEMEVHLETAQQLRVTLDALVVADAESFEGVRVAARLPKGTQEEEQQRATAMREALLHAAAIPLETARVAVDVAALAATLAERGNQNAVGDAAAAALLAEAACRGAALNVRLNVSGLDDEGAARGARLASQARAHLDTASLHARLAEAAAERSLSQTP